MKLFYLIIFTLILLTSCLQKPTGPKEDSTDPTSLIYSEGDIILKSVYPMGGIIDGGYVVTISGQNFSKYIQSVKIGNLDCSTFWYVNSTTLKCTIPEATSSIIGTYLDISVTNSYNNKTTILPKSFIYIRPLKVTKLSGARAPIGGGTLLTITGDGFMEKTEVYIGPSKCENIKITSNTSLYCRVPASSAGLFDVTVVNNYSANFTKFEVVSNAFIYDPKPKTASRVYLSPFTMKLTGNSSQATLLPGNKIDGSDDIATIDNTYIGNE